ncbi:L-2,4-diaminobutyrate decarboxylase [Filomicrobium insigne]|uniref:L-2,4-diaminobutyrate decarboxylase n=1 Tax=Filomicrobium insigne TaxID=418854 RepID=A0A1H0Q4T4_9HYPH|nr:pyridoxal-dependent decarboxylase [Filomicrobium insigne]SDP12441.1 L-2,4-diaminobutyrate decarboxylase [Filomicrobium insigne]
MGFREDVSITVDALDAFARDARKREGPVLRQERLVPLQNALDVAHLIEHGGLEGQTLQRFLDTYLAASTRLHHPGYMAHQVAVPLSQSAIAALVDGFTNNAMAIYEMGPAAAAVEHAVINWMLEKIGWRPCVSEASDKTADGGGVLTHGGSLANLTALLAARARVVPNAWQEGNPSHLVIVASPSSHYSVSRAAGIMGLGSVRYAPTDSAGRLDPTRLSGFLAGLQQEGTLPLALVANACGTALGLYDPLREIAHICRQHHIWLHVDGAHGASALLSQRLRHLLDGIELADSVVWDAHKMLRSSTLCAAVLTRDPLALDRAFREEASYLFHEKDQPGIDLIHRTVECTKAALGLKVFFALASQGEKSIAATIERQTAFAQETAAYLRTEPEIEVAVEPQSNIVCFRFDGPDSLQLKLRRRLTESGNFYISTAEALGRRWLRIVFMNPSTNLNDVVALINELREYLKSGV